MKRKNLIGQRFERLFVIEEVEQIKKERRFLCKCDCGNEKIIPYSSLIAGHSRSCGCLHKEFIDNYNKTRDYNIIRKKHSNSENHNPRIRHEWLIMLWRVNENNLEKRNRYFDRGITVCSEWMTSYDSFCNWALANGYQDNLTLDRIDNDKGYTPENCRWVDYLTQENNKSSNVFIEIEGEKHSVSEWCRIKGISRDTVYSRIRKGWSYEDALLKPVRKKSHRFF